MNLKHVSPVRPLAAIVCSAMFLTISSVAFADPIIVRAEAYSNGEVGVGKIVFRLDKSDQLAIQTNAIHLTTPNQRAFYPAFSVGLLDQLYAAQWTSVVPAGGTHNVWFLFRGTEPLEITLHANSSTSTRIDVNQRRPRFQKLMTNMWWTHYSGALRRSEKTGDVVPISNAYLKVMLPKRLGLKPTLLDRVQETQPDPLQETLTLIFGGETAKTAAINDLMNQPDRDSSRVPVPAVPNWRQNWIPSSDEQLKIESIAGRVPEECFYLRFGQWQNQLWLKSLLEEYGGDLSKMVAMRGYQQPASADFLKQLVLESSEIDDLFGGQLISDVAVIGLDLFLEDGAAIGVILESKGKFLNSNLMGKRKKYAKDHQASGVTLNEEKLASHSISFLASSDNRVRSFYVQDGDYHLITNSRALMQRFLQSGRGAKPLAENAGFRLARTTFPLDRDDTVFVYLSPQFFENLVGPEYQIGFRRRTRSNAAQQLKILAQAAARNEGLTDVSYSQLAHYQFLPARSIELGHAFDHSDQGTIAANPIEIPIPDQKIESVTADEARWYGNHLSQIQQQFPAFDPLLIAIKRYELKKNVERVVFDARLAPFGQENYGWISSILGPPLDYEIAHSHEDLVTFQLSVKGGQLRPEIGAHQIFGAIQNDAQSVELAPMTFFEWIKFFKSVPGYVGAWPKPGWLDVFPFGLGGRPDEQGYTKSLLTGIWRLQHGEFSVLSFDRHRLETLRPNLDVREAKRNAQVRVKIGDVASSNLAGWANRLSYQSTWQTSVATVRAANLLTQQFGISRIESMKVLTQLNGVQYVCPLGGKYELIKNENETLWRSSKWPNIVGSLPADYQSPFLNWFKGAEVEVTQVEGQFSVHGSLDIQRHNAASMTLPSFNLFKGFPEILPIGSKKEK